MVQIVNPFASFQPKIRGNVQSQYPELRPWEALGRYRKEEQRGMLSWAGGEVPGIPTKTRIPPTPPLEQIFGDLFKRLWKTGQTPTGPQRNLLAQHRPVRPGQPAPAYRPMPSPTRQGASNIAVAGQQPGPSHAHLMGIARDWELHKSLERYSGYAFRGDARSSAEIKQAGGFQPSATRNDDSFIKGAVYAQFCDYMSRSLQIDMKSAVKPQEFLAIVRETIKTTEAREVFLHYTGWRTMVKAEELHLGRMLAEETLKAYISTTRAVPVAKGFASSSAKRQSRTEGWVYCVAVLGGFVVPPKKPNSWTADFGEQEIAKAGPIPWSSVAAARAVDTNGMFTGDIYVREGFDKIDPGAFEPIFKLLSGKKQ